MAASITPAKSYFGYGSNLWKDQMARRCPSSPFTGVGRLRGYRWIINSRGYANIAETGAGSDEVWGLIYDLAPADEVRLDVNEGVPYAYEKAMIPVEFWAEGQLPGGREATAATAATAAAVVVEMLVYIDYRRCSGEGNKPRDEYVHRMNQGIRDALHEGVPESYVNGVVRRYIPAAEVDARTRQLAVRQAASFVDQSGVLHRTGSGSGMGVGVGEEVRERSE